MASEETVVDGPVSITPSTQKPSPVRSSSVSTRLRMFMRYPWYLPLPALEMRSMHTAWTKMRETGSVISQVRSSGPGPSVVLSKRADSTGAPSRVIHAAMRSSSKHLSASSVYLPAAVSRYRSSITPRSPMVILAEKSPVSYMVISAMFSELSQSGWQGLPIAPMSAAKRRASARAVSQTHGLPVWSSSSEHRSSFGLQLLSRASQRIHLSSWPAKEMHSGSP
mmetsp:Transcript_9861/g.14844  ORF Transcript_9861/g.14844 Transcript_9861/m.14844 type:complete len:223 (-) Transcript_9861:1003-1671(-)